MRVWNYIRFIIFGKIAKIKQFYNSADKMPKIYIVILLVVKVVLERTKMEAILDRKIPFQDICRLVVCSDLRKNILMSLYEGKKQLRELRDNLNVSSTTAIHTLRELEKYNLIVQEKDKNYSLTNIGRIATLKLLDFISVAEVLRKHERFWLEHDLSGIPEPLMEKIGCLRDSIIIENTSTELFKVHTNFMNLLQTAKKIRGVSPIYHSEFLPLFEKLVLSKKVDVELILTKEVIEKIDDATVKKIFALKSSKFDVYLIKEAKAAFTVTDFFLSLGLYNYDGTYDYNRDLLTYDEKGIEWGRNLYDGYLLQAEKI